MGSAVEKKVHLTNLIKAVDFYNNKKEVDRKAYITNRRNNKNTRSNPVLKAIIEGLQDINPDYDPLDFIVAGLSRLRIWGVIDNIGHYDIITEGLNAYNVSRESDDFILYCLNDFERRKDFIEKYVTKEGYKWKESEIGSYKRQVVEDLENYTTGDQSSILSRLRLLFDDEVAKLEMIESYYEKNESQLTVKSLFKNGEFNATVELLNDFFWRNQSIDKSSSLIDHFRSLSRYSSGLMRTRIIRDKIKEYSQEGMSGIDVDESPKAEILSNQSRVNGNNDDDNGKLWATVFYFGIGHKFDPNKPNTQTLKDLMNEFRKSHNVINTEGGFNKHYYNVKNIVNNPEGMTIVTSEGKEEVKKYSKRKLSGMAAIIQKAIPIIKEHYSSEIVLAKTAIGYLNDIIKKSD